VINSTSLKLRLLFSVVLNFLRALLTFATGVFIARALSPSPYGDMMFLIGSFVAIRSLLDLGSSNAFLLSFLSDLEEDGFI